MLEIVYTKSTSLLNPKPEMVYNIELENSHQLQYMIVMVMGDQARENWWL